MHLMRISLCRCAGSSLSGSTRLYGGSSGNGRAKLGANTCAVSGSGGGPLGTSADELSPKDYRWLWLYSVLVLLPRTRYVLANDRQRQTARAGFRRDQMAIGILFVAGARTFRLAGRTAGRVELPAKSVNIVCLPSPGLRACRLMKCDTDPHRHKSK